MKTWVTLAIMIGMIVGLNTAQPLEAVSSGKIAYVDIARLFDDYMRTKEQDKRLEEKGNAKQSERDVMVTEIRRLKDEMELLSETGKTQKQAVIDEKIRKLQEFDRVVREDLRKERDAVVREILKEIEQVVQEYGEKQGYSLVLSNRDLMYGAKDLDLTDQILVILNDRYSRKGK